MKEDNRASAVDHASCNEAKIMKHCAGGGRKILAHSYVLWQSYDKAFCPREALTKGTLFPDLWGVYKIPK